MLDWNFLAYCFRVLNKTIIWEIVGIFAETTIYAADDENSENWLMGTDWTDGSNLFVTLRKNDVV